MLEGFDGQYRKLRPALRSTFTLRLKFFLWILILVFDFGVARRSMVYLVLEEGIRLNLSGSFDVVRGAPPRSRCVCGAFDFDFTGIRITPNRSVHFFVIVVTDPWVTYPIISVYFT